MSASQFDEFDRRMRRISKRQSKLSRGHVTKVNPDGLVVAKPKRRSYRSLMRGAVILIAALMIFKGVAYQQLGANVYEARVSTLKEGSVLEQSGALLMTPDPVTIWISNKIASLVR